MSEPTSTEEPPGVYQYQGSTGPTRDNPIQAYYMENFPHSPERDAQWLSMLGEEADRRGEVVARAIAVDQWNVERDILPPE